MDSPSKQRLTMDLPMPSTKRRPRANDTPTAFSSAVRVLPTHRNLQLHRQFSIYVSNPTSKQTFRSNPIVPKHNFPGKNYGPAKLGTFPIIQMQSNKTDKNNNTATPLSQSRLASTAAAAAAAVNASISNKPITAPSTSAKSFIAREDLPTAPLDPEGLPLSYDRDAIEAFWRKSSGSLQKRWAEFLAVSVPFFTRLLSLGLSGGMENIQANTKSLAEDAVKGAEKLGPTYIKLGQMLSSRPDVLPKEALLELSKLQDAVKTFDTSIAISIIESELGDKMENIFEEFSEEPVAAASLAQVYRATLKENGQEVAVKVQRPNARSLISKDLYVLRRAAQIYQGVMERFVPQQNTDYIALFDEWAVGFYTELDFQNEMKNQVEIKEQLLKNGIDNVYIPDVCENYCRRRVLVSEWVNGIKLSQCTGAEIKTLTEIGQQAFLVQLFQMGLSHVDPHAGNLLKLDNGQLCLLDFGLVATLKKDDINTIVNAIIHLANKDYSSLIDDFIQLEILQKNCDRAKIMPLMDKALSPYVKGGGAKKYEAEIRKTYGMSEGTNMGGFSAMTRDAVTVFRDIPFSIPPYFALIARAIVTLEGIALQGNQDYSLIMEAYPFVAKKLIRDDTPQLQKALQDVLYGNNSGGNTISLSRLSSLVVGAMGIVSKTEGGVFVDLDSVNENVPITEILKYILSNEAVSLRNILKQEIDEAVDVLLRQSLRKVIRTFAANAPTPSRIPFVGGLLPIPPTEELPIPVLIPGSTIPSIMSVKKFTDTFAPPLSREEEIYALALVDAANEVFGSSAASIVSGDALIQIDSLRSSFIEPFGKIINREFSNQSLFSTVTNPDDMGRLMVNGILPPEITGAVEGLNNAEREQFFNECRGITERAWNRCFQRLEARS